MMHFVSGCNFKRYLLSFICYLCLTICFTAFTSFLLTSESLAEIQNTQEEKKVIRIGYQPERAFYNSIGETRQEGYGYEYMTKILSYTKNAYTPEYIPVAWGDGFEMLKNGELDLLPFAKKNEERAKNYLYSKKPLTFEKPILLSLKEDRPYISSDYRELQGKKICIYDDNIYHENFLEYLNENRIYPLVIRIPFKTIAELKEEGDYDYILSTSLLMGYNTVSPIGLDSKLVYILGNQDNTDLMADIDEAMAKLETDDFLFEKKLAIKYFKNFGSKIEHLSLEQQELIEEQVYDVGLIPLDTQLVFLTAEGNLAGICVDVLKTIADRGNFNVNFHILPSYATDDEINQYDLSFLPYQNQISSIFPLSNMFAATPFILVKDPSRNQQDKYQDKYTVGTLEQFHLNQNFLSTTLQTPPDEYIVFHTARELLKAFYKGEVEEIIITHAIYNIYHDMLSKYSITYLGFDYGIRFSFSQEFPEEKIKIFNILITQIDEDTLYSSVIRNIALFNHRSIGSYAKEYWYVILLALVLLVCIFILSHKKAQKQKAYELKLANDINPITGMYTFPKFLIEAKNFIEKHPKKDLRIFTLDIDHFSYINEIFGFETGSKVLGQIAHHLQDRVKDYSPITNYAGDDFVVITYKRTDNVKDFLNYLQLDRLTSTLESMLSNYAKLSLSFGVYDIVDRNLEVSYMVDCANIACHKSKEFFGTHAEFYTEHMKEESILQNKMLTLIKNALENKEFELYYQPKFDIDYMHVVGAEALIRWFREGKMIPPDKFIPIAEKHGLINELDYHVIELACQFISQHKQDCLPHISINISGFTIIKTELVDKLIEITRKYNVKPQKIDIEITETALVNNFDMAIKQILQLRQLGFSISMDDFGTGVSSLNRLSQMPLDTIKLDRVFIIDALENKKSAVVVQTVIDLAKKINAKTVAEGIETQEQLELLRDLSCEHGQGYFYARPMSEKNFLEYLEKCI